MIVRFFWLFETFRSTIKETDIGNHSPSRQFPESRTINWIYFCELRQSWEAWVAGGVVKWYFHWCHSQDGCLPQGTIIINSDHPVKLFSFIFLQFASHGIEHLPHETIICLSIRDICLLTIFTSSENPAYRRMARPCDYQRISRAWAIPCDLAMQQRYKVMPLQLPKTISWYWYGHRLGLLQAD